MTSERDTPSLPEHIEQTVKAIAQMHTEHREGATAIQHALDRVRDFIGHARFVVILCIFVPSWIALNTALTLAGLASFDAPPFFWLQGLIGLTALCTTILVLATQARDDELARRREHLTLELAILGEQKSAKIIQLLEDLRRDHPDIANRVDREAGAMSKPADPKVVLDAIKSSEQTDG